MGPLWSSSVDKQESPALASHSLTVASLLPEAMALLVGCQSQAFTSPPCPVSAASGFRVLKSHTYGRMQRQVRSDTLTRHPIASCLQHAAWCESYLHRVPSTDVQVLSIPCQHGFRLWITALAYLPLCSWWLFLTGMTLLVGQAHRYSARISPDA